MIPARIYILYTVCVVVVVFASGTRGVAQDRKIGGSVPKGEIVLYGHSLFTQWRTAGKDLSPLPVHNLAFGGSRTHQLTARFDTLVLPYKPRLIVLNTGANFIGFNRNTPEAFAKVFVKLLDKIHQELPETRILWMSITPCPKAWEKVRANQFKGTRLAQKIIAQRDYVDFIDMDSIAVDKNGRLIPEIFKSDGIHYVRAGYEAYIRVLKPAIVAEWDRMTSGM
jgi:hypothetical protein